MTVLNATDSIATNDSYWPVDETADERDSEQKHAAGSHANDDGISHCNQHNNIQHDTLIHSFIHSNKDYLFSYLLN